MKKMARFFALISFLILLLSPLAVGVSAAGEQGDAVLSSPVEYRSRICDLLRGNTKRKGDEAASRRLIPGGDAFGIRLESDGVLIVGMSEQSEERVGEKAGLKIGDLIVKIDQTPVRNVAELKRALGESKGNVRIVTVKRHGKESEIEVCPREDAGEIRLGILVRDSTAGIGTVTFIDPASGAFGGLGHGISDSESGELVSVRRGAAMRVLIDSIERGRPGTPGELRGSLCPDKLGTVLANTERGVFGFFAERGNEAAAVPVADAAEVHPGRAVLRCSLLSGKPTDYAIEIGDIHREERGSKCFSLEIKDPALISLTGGIVQGMSGSPILQDGKLIGAVTHVMIRDPLRGYGIFIGNMLADADALHP